MTSNILINGATGNTTGTPIILNAPKVAIGIKTVGGSVGGTVNIFGQDGLGNDYLIDTKAFTSATTEIVAWDAKVYAVYATITSYSAGTFTVTIAGAY